MAGEDDDRPVVMVGDLIGWSRRVRDGGYVSPEDWAVALEEARVALAERDRRRLLDAADARRLP